MGDHTSKTLFIQRHYTSYCGSQKRNKKYILFGFSSLIEWTGRGESEGE